LNLIFIVRRTVRRKARRWQGRRDPVAPGIDD
jgi:hypothetical protein